jgi:hypothetical protein
MPEQRKYDLLEGVKPGNSGFILRIAEALNDLSISGMQVMARAEPTPEVLEVGRRSIAFALCVHVMAETRQTGRGASTVMAEMLPLLTATIDQMEHDNG